MAAFTVYAGTQWTRPIVLGSLADRWRLDDWHVYADFVAPGASSPVISLSVGEGIVIIDPVARRMEVALTRAQVATLAVGTAYAFDFLLVNKADGRAERTPPQTLTVLAGITEEPT